MQRLAVVLPNWIGDVAMATPALRALRAAYPDAEITGVLKPYVAPVLDGSDWLDRRLLLDSRSGDLTRWFWNAVGELRREWLDAVLLFTRSWSAAFLGWLSRAPVRVGYGDWATHWLLTDTLDKGPAGARESTVEQYLRLVETVGVKPQGRDLELATSFDEKRRAHQIWRQLGLDDAGYVIGFNTGGAFGEAKHWPREHYIELANRIIADPRAAVLVLAGPREAETAEAITTACDHPRVRTVAGIDTTLAASKGCLERLDALVTTDSGPRHLAAALGTATVSLLGPIDGTLSRNFSAADEVVSLELACQPCGERVCPLEHGRCMRDLTPDLVYAAVERRIRGESALRSTG